MGLIREIERVFQSSYCGAYQSWLPTPNCANDRQRATLLQGLNRNCRLGHYSLYNRRGDRCLSRFERSARLERLKGRGGIDSELVPISGNHSILIEIRIIFLQAGCEERQVHDCRLGALDGQNLTPVRNIWIARMDILLPKESLLQLEEGRDFLHWLHCKLQHNHH